MNEKDTKQAYKILVEHRVHSIHLWLDRAHIIASTVDDEVQSHYQLGNTGKPLYSMNLDELQKNVISAD
ncbi:hypothetical protein JHK87_053150 [Glycine soja]|nr:hypothetical protein JHK87_053150 [Glycine soja]